MALSSVQVRVDSALKKKAEKVLDDIGLDLPTAFRVFLKKIVATRSIPFLVSSEEPSSENVGPSFERQVLAALAESKDPKKLSGPFSSAEDLIAHLRKQNA